MNSLSAAGHVTNWRDDWLWSLPLIVVTVLIHLFGLTFLHERVVRPVGRVIEQRHFSLRFAAVLGARYWR
jgi:hypothetical protein